MFVSLKKKGGRRRSKKERMIASQKLALCALLI